MNMLSFYGGPAGKDFTITKIFTSKAKLDADIALGNTSPLYVGDYVLISYGDPNTPEFATNLAEDGDISYNATLWKKEWDNGYGYKEIASIASSYPKFITGNIEASLPFGAPPQLAIDSSSLARPKIGLKMPASLKAGTANTVEAVAPTSTPSVTPIYNGALGDELSFKIKIPRGTTFTPSLSNTGELSWTNDGGLANPATINIKGPKGEGGTIEITGVSVDDSSSEIAAPSVEVISSTTDPQHAKYSLSFHNLTGKRGPQGLRGYYFLPNVSTNGDLSWTNNSNGELANPATINIRGPQGEIGSPLNIIANEIITVAQVADDTTVAVGIELTARGWNPSSGQLIGVTYQKTENNVTSYWYFKINGEWQRVQLSGGIGSVIINKKITDSTAIDKVYSAAYINALEARLRVLEEALTIGKISEIGGR